jgi:hypothetical protein
VLQETVDLARGKDIGRGQASQAWRQIWRIRWLDERGKRQSAVFDDYGSP